VEWPADDTATEEIIMMIICFKPMTTNNGEPAICGAVQMTGFDGSKHTLRSDLPCRGCGEAGHYDGVGDDWTAMKHNGLQAINSATKPVREL
tara:strand:- start:1986 stop:2261 length:276 start_codon:yes stop_codon:yes gene_type:complete